MKKKKVEVNSEKLTTKEVLVNLIRSKAVGLFDAEPRAGLSLSQVERLAEEIIKLF